MNQATTSRAKVADATIGSSPVWCPDSGDGAYVNPVLFADYSDPDAIRVGDDYWLTSSSFSHVPGLPILHSRDLVNWSIVNHALPRLVPEQHFSQPRHGEGVWAPSIRHHAGKFWIFYPDPDFGIYVVTAEDPRGAWTPPVMVKRGKGLIDPCPFWDADGTAYLIHGWAKSRAGVSNRLTLHRMNAAATAVVDEGVVIIDGDRMPGWNTIEGPKLYQRSGYYYVFAPAGGVRDGYQAVFRARDIFGPYESRVVLAQGSTAINGPHQGAWIDTPAGENWFLHFQEMPVYGRVVHLQPMRWSSDGWPVIGNEMSGKCAGEPLLAGRKPWLELTSVVGPATSDEFERSQLGRQWQWQANPQPGWAVLEACPGSLRLACVTRGGSETLWSAAHLLLQKFSAPAFSATTVLDFSAATNGDRAGLIVFGHDYHWIGLRREQDGMRLVACQCRAAHEGGREIESASLPYIGERVLLRVAVEAGGRCRFSYAPPGGAFSAIGAEWRATASFWVGAKVGLFAAGVSGAVSGGHADFDWFRVGRL